MVAIIPLPCANGPDLAWPDLLAQSRNTVVVFTSIQCPYALAYYDVIRDLSARFGGPDWQFVLVNSNVDSEDDPEGLDAMREQYGSYPVPFVRDEGSSLATLLGATHTPQAFVVSADGRVRWSGPIDKRFRPSEEWQEGLSGHWPWDDDPPPPLPVTRVEEVLQHLRGGDGDLPREFGIGCTIKAFREGRQ